MFNCLVLGKENKVATIIPISIVLIFIPDDGTVAEFLMTWKYRSCI